MTAPDRITVRRAVLRERRRIMVVLRGEEAFLRRVAKGARKIDNLSGAEWQEARAAGIASALQRLDERNERSDRAARKGARK